jgi:collagen type I alpha
MARRMRSTLMGERGSTIIAALVFALVTTLIAGALFKLATLDARSVVDQAAKAQALYAAESGVNAAWLQMGNGDGTNDWGTVSVNTFSAGTQIVPTGSIATQLGTNSYNASYTATKCGTSGVGAECTGANFPAPSTGTYFWIKSVGAAASTVVAQGPRQATIYARYDSSGKLPCPGGTGGCAVVTCGDITIGGGGVRDTDSFDSRTGAYGGTNVGNDGDIITLLGNISLSGNVWGDATAGGTGSNGNITGSTYHGATNQHAVFSQACYTGSNPLMSPVSPCPANTTYTNGSGFYNGTLTGVGTVSYDSTTGDLTVQNNASNLTLPPLAGGAKYCFHSVTVKSGATLQVSGASTANPVVMNLTGPWNSQGGGITNDANVPGALQIESCYGRGAVDSAYTAACGNSSNNGVKFQGNSITYAVFYAPYADVTCSPCNIAGQLIGKTLNLQGGSGTIHYDEALGAGGLVIGAQNWTRGKWVVVQAN